MNNQFAEIGKRLSQYLALKGISQSKLARLTATSASQVFNMLNGTRYGVDKLLLVFQALPDLSPEWLLFGTGQMEKTKHTGNIGLTRSEEQNSETTSTGNIPNQVEGGAVRLREVEEELTICRAEKSGLERIIELKNEMIAVLKKQL